MGYARTAAAGLLLMLSAYAQDAKNEELSAALKKLGIPEHDARSLISRGATIDDLPVLNAFLKGGTKPSDLDSLYIGHRNVMKSEDSRALALRLAPHGLSPTDLWALNMYDAKKEHAAWIELFAKQDMDTTKVVAWYRLASTGSEIPDELRPSANPSPFLVGWAKEGYDLAHISGFLIGGVQPTQDNIRNAKKFRDAKIEDESRYMAWGLKPTEKNIRIIRGLARFETVTASSFGRFRRPTADDARKIRDQNLNLIAACLYGLEPTDNREKLLADHMGIRFPFEESGVFHLVKNDVPVLYAAALQRFGPSEVVEMFRDKVPPHDADMLLEKGLDAKIIPHRLYVRRIPVISKDPDAVFSGKVSYKELRKGGIRVAVYQQPFDSDDIMSTKEMDVALRELNRRARKSGVKFYSVKTRKEFMKVWEGKEDIVVAFAAANWGRGLSFDQSDTPTYLSFGNGDVIVPTQYKRENDVVVKELEGNRVVVKGGKGLGTKNHPKVFLYVGGRAEKHYGPALNEGFPGMEFMGPQYINLVYTRPDVTLRALLTALERRESRTQLARRLNRTLAFNLAEAIGYEWGNYKNANPIESFDTNLYKE